MDATDPRRPSGSVGAPGHVGAARVRDGTPRDAAACAAVYAPYVTGEVTTFELAVPSTADMAARISSCASTHAWLVLEDGGRVVGYAYGAPFKDRPAYQWSCEVSVYLERGRRRTGGGRALYDVLLARLAARGFRTAAAGITVPNEASVGLHESFGFEPVGTFRDIGWKLGAWRDVLWMQRQLSLPGDPPPPPT